MTKILSFLTLVVTLGSSANVFAACPDYQREQGVCYFDAMKKYDEHLAAKLGLLQTYSRGLGEVGRALDSTQESLEKYRQSLIRLRASIDDLSQAIMDSYDRQIEALNALGDTRNLNEMTSKDLIY